MRNPTQNNRGTTLVELVVCMALLGIFSVAIVALIQPCSKAFVEMQQLTRAQNLADSIIERFRGEMLQGTQQIRFAEAGSNVFDLLPYNEDTSGSALELYLSSGYLLLIDAGEMPKTKLTGEQNEDGTYKYADSMPAGTVHFRYFQPRKESGTDPAAHNYPNRPVNSDGQSAYTFTEAYPQNAYMGMRIKLKFALQGYKFDESQNAAVSAIAVEVFVTKEDGETVICSQKGILSLPNEPILVKTK